LAGDAVDPARRDRGRYGVPSAVRVETAERDGYGGLGRVPEEDSMVEAVNDGRRRFLVAATSLTGVVGAGFALTPFVASWQPSIRAKTLSGPVEIDLSKLEPGAILRVRWRGKPVWVVRRSPEMLKQLRLANPFLRDPESEASVQPPYAKNEARARNPEYLVLLGICTHLGCSPTPKFAPADAAISADWPGGFFCACHGSKFDLSGRVFKGMVATSNMTVPPYVFLSDTRVLIGSDTTASV
jgi:ubiquinol-cytochrome c reductase iron-sulfur subunit